MRRTCCAGAIQTIASSPASGGRPIIGLFNRSLLTNASTELLYSSGVSDNDRPQSDSSDLGQCGSQVTVASYHPFIAMYGWRTIRSEVQVFLANAVLRDITTRFVDCPIS